MSLKDQAYQTLRQKIVNQVLKPGTPLIETDLALELGMSRTPIREAIKLLVEEGLAISYSSRSTFVSQINPQDVEDIYLVRIHLEKLALELSFADISQEEVGDLIRLYQSFLLEDDIQVPYEVDKKFHNLWTKHCHNKVLIKLIKQLNTQLERYRRFSLKVKKRSKKSIQESLNILYAIQNRDLEACKIALETHLINAKLNIQFDQSNYHIP